MLTSDLFHSDAWNIFQIAQMLLTAKMLTRSSIGPTLDLHCTLITRMLLFDLYRPDTYS